VRAFAILVAIVVLVPAVLHYPTLETEILTFGLLAVAFNVLLGELGFFSLGQATFYGVGGYAVAGALFGHVPFILALVVAALAGALASALAGALAIQRRGVYGVMLTFAINEMAYYIALQWRDVTGGDNGLRGLPLPDLFGFSLDDPYVYYYFTAVIVLAAFYFVLRLEGSPLGSVFRAIRENEARAASIGYRVRWFKITAFAITGALCGLAGGLQAELFRFVPLESISIQTSTSIVAATLLGGLGSPYGPLVGAAIYITLSNTFSHVWSHWPLLFGLLFCAVVLFFRAGVWGIATRWTRQAVRA
jgi:branched-chain amino acid transport system permease protein